jgi:hypothetical protein
MQSLLGPQQVDVVNRILQFLQVSHRVTSSDALMPHANSRAEHEHCNNGKCTVCHIFTRLLLADLIFTIYVQYGCI